MQLQLTPAEQEFLAHLLEERYRELLREIRHTDSRDFRAALRANERLVESLLEKLGVPQAVAH